MAAHSVQLHRAVFFALLGTALALNLKQKYLPGKRVPASGAFFAITQLCGGGGFSVNWDMVQAARR